jgi:hypothetical protein
VFAVSLSLLACLCSRLIPVGPKEEAAQLRSQLEDSHRALRQVQDTEGALAALRSDKSALAAELARARAENAALARENAGQHEKLLKTRDGLRLLIDTNRELKVRECLTRLTRLLIAF